MDLREKDTLLIVVSFMLIVLLVIFFLTEARRYTLHSYEISREGARDVYSLCVKKYRFTSEKNKNLKKDLLSQGRMRIIRTVLGLGEDRKGTVQIICKEDPGGDAAGYYREMIKPIDLNNYFLPEGSCNFDFFDSDIIGHCGEMVRTEETWKFFRDLSLFGSTERNVEIRYRFIGKRNIDGREYGVIHFSTHPEPVVWLEDGLNTVEKLSGEIWVSGATGRMEKIEYSFIKRDEKKGELITVNMHRTGSKLLSKAELNAIRNNKSSTERSGVLAINNDIKIPALTARGNKQELNDRFFSEPTFWTVQVSASSNRQKAINLCRILKKRGYKSILLRKNDVYRVCAGKFPKEDPELKKTKEKLAPHFKDCFVRPLP